MKKELSVIAGAIVLGAGLMVSVSASAGAPRVAFAIKPMAQAGTNSVKPMAQAGTNSVRPGAQAGTN